MSGQCSQCGTGFGRFKKEYGCKNCGFSFCGKCLTKKTEIPKLKNERHSVCNKCFDVLTGKSQPQNPRQMSPPEALRKRMAALQNMETKPKVASQQTSVKAPKPSHKNLSKQDAEIADRLEKLKAERKMKEPLQSDEELNSRLAKLKGLERSQAETSKKQAYHPPDRRSEQEQINDLMNEIGDELELESRLPDAACEVERRLAHLKGSEGAEGGAASDQQTSSRKTMKGGEGNLNIVNNLNKGGSQKPLSYSKNINIDCDRQSGNKAYKDNDNVDLEEMNQLIAQAAKELEIDAQKAIAGLQKDNEIMKKLSEIKKRKKSSQGEEEGEESGLETSLGEKTLKFNIAADVDEDSDEEDEDQATKKLISRLLEESKLDEAAAADGYPPSDLLEKKKIKQSPKKSNIPTPQDVSGEPQETDELPWCCICNEDATVRCHGCDLDLYCDKCFHQGHDDALNHKTSRYTRPKSLEGL